MANHDNLNRDEAYFVQRTVLVSFVVLSVLINLLVLALQRQDDIRALLAEIHAETGSYSSALRQVEDIEDKTKRIDNQYIVACIMQDNKDFEPAAEQFLMLNGYKDSSDRYLRCRYDTASQYYDSGSYEEALEIFSELNNYSDSMLRKNQVMYSKAEKACTEGEYAQAIMLFLSLGDYGDAGQRAFDAALKVTGDQAAAEEMLTNGGMTGEEMERAIHIAERRSLMPEFSIAAGSYHTVVLRPDGTVAACGDNSSGQCDVSGWQNIVQVHAGSKHTVGLKSDGTVVATGDNRFGQCNVSDWTGVSELTVNDFNTIALLSDGTVESCGYNTYDSIERATNVSHVFSGGYGVIAITNDGTCIASHRSHSIMPAQRIIHASLNTGYAAFVYSDGTCAFSVDLGEIWEGIVHVDAGPTAVIGVDVNGGIKARFFRKSETVDMTTDKEVLQCAAGTAHFVFLTADGEVIAFGDNSLGQCDVKGLRE